jgi:hypothetical protein
MLICAPVRGAKSSGPAMIIQEIYETTGGVSELALSLGRAYGVSVFA